MAGEIAVDKKALITAASEARKNAYCPYSHYRVGAAILGADGRIYTGVNVENLSFGLTVCAERNAVGAMAAGGCQRLLSVAVATKDGGSPCGACRQVLIEFAADPRTVAVILAAEDGRLVEMTLADLLPSAFKSQL